MNEITQNLKMSVAGSGSSMGNNLGMNVILLSIVSAVITLSGKIIDKFMPHIEQFIENMYNKYINLTYNTIDITYTAWYSSRRSEWESSNDEQFARHMKMLIKLFQK